MRQEIVKSWRKILSIAGTTLVVYLVFRFALPLILPFILAFLVAVLIRSPVRWLRKALHIKESIGAVLVLAASGGILVLILNYGGGLLLRELQGLLTELHNHNIVKWLSGESTGKLIILGKDCTALLEQMQKNAEQYFTWERCIGYCMSHSSGLVRWCTGFFTALFVFFIASVLAVEEMERLHQRLTRCIFYKEIVDFGSFLGKICGKWVQVQILIMLITMAISSLGLWITGFSYALLLGIFIGFVDVLPILGTGTIYIPWILWEFLNRNPGRGISLLVIYLICYFTRELMENGLMGKCMGITAFEFLAAVYVGLKLFGAAGFILGPVGVLIVMWVADCQVDNQVNN